MVVIRGYNHPTKPEKKPIDEAKFNAWFPRPVFEALRGLARASRALGQE